MKYTLEIPEKLHSHYLEAYKEIGNQLINDPKIVTAFLSNSLLDSKPDLNSDLDIVAITNEDFWQRKQLSINGVFIELFLYSKDELIKSFDSGDYQDMHMVAYGFDMFDKNKQAKEIKINAEEKFIAGPGTPDLEKNNYLKYLVWDNYCDVLDVISENSVNSIALMHKSVWFAVEVYFSLNNKWFCKPKKLLTSVKKLDEELYLLLNDFYNINNQNIDELFKSYSKIIEKVISPHSIKEHFVWESNKHKGSYKLL